MAEADLLEVRFAILVLDDDTRMRQIKRLHHFLVTQSAILAVLSLNLVRFGLDRL